MNKNKTREKEKGIIQTMENDDGNISVEEAEITVMSLYITVTHKTADEMADAYNFTADQRARLVELLTE